MLLSTVALLKPTKRTLAVLLTEPWTPSLLRMVRSNVPSVERALELRLHVPVGILNRPEDGGIREQWNLS